MMLKHTRFLSLLALSFLVGGCATHYGPKSDWTGIGYTDARFDENTARINYFGADYMTRDVVENYLLYRAAEFTAQNGFDYFIFESRKIRPIHNVSVTPNTVTKETTHETTKHHDKVKTTTETIQPGHEIHTVHYEASGLIKMYRGSKPEGMPRAYDAHSLLRYLSPSIKK